MSYINKHLIEGLKAMGVKEPTPEKKQRNRSNVPAMTKQSNYANQAYQQQQQHQQRTQWPQYIHKEEHENSYVNESQIEIQQKRKLQYRKHVVIIDSNDRDINAYPTPTSYRVDLPTTYKQVRIVRLLSVEIPSSYYVFTALFNTTTLHFILYESGNWNSYTITIPDGNYSSITICPALMNAFTSFNPNYSYDIKINSATFEVTSNVINTLTQDNIPIAIDTRMYANNKAISNWGLEYNLGFIKNQVTYPPSIITSTILTYTTAPNIINLNPYNYIILDIPEINGMDECGRSVRSAFAKIPVNVNSFDMIMLNVECCTYNETILNPIIAKLSKLTVNWRFHDMNPIIFNNYEHSFTLEIECLE